MLLLISLLSPSKLGIFEKKIVEDSLELAVTIVVKLLPLKINMLDVLARIFDPVIPFYQGICYLHFS
jgi:hypothetical protein